MPFDQRYTQPQYLGGGPIQAQMPQRAIPMQPMQPMAPQMPPPQLPQMPPQIPQGVHPQMMPRPQMPQGMGRITDAEGMAMQKMMMEKARQQRMMEQMFMQERIRGMLGEWRSQLENQRSQRKQKNLNLNRVPFTDASN